MCVIIIDSIFSEKLYHKTFVNFRRFCSESDMLPVDLHVVLSDILSGVGHVTDILPYFMRHARRIFPHLECIDDLRHISDIRLPANWYSITPYPIFLYNINCYYTLIVKMTYSNYFIYIIIFNLEDNLEILVVNFEYCISY